MLVSILHRTTGMALTVAGLALLTWWMLATAGSAAAYNDFTAAATHPLGLFVLIGLTWAFFQHTLSGVRHLIMDSGTGLELGKNKAMAYATMIGSLVLTAAMWGYLLLVRV